MSINDIQQQITLPNVWYGTQLAALFFSFLSFTTNFKTVYTLAYISIATSFIISLYQSLTATQKANASKNTEESTQNKTTVLDDPKQKIVEFVNSIKPLIKPAQSHATTPYILLSLACIFILPRSTLTLTPYAIFAFFHALNYTRTFVLPRLGLNANIQSQANIVMEYINTRFHTPAFKAAVWSQLFTFLTTVVSTLINFPLNIVGYGDGHSMLNFTAVFIWLSFISAVMKDNILMRAAINEIVTIVDDVTLDPRIPSQVRGAWLKAKHIITYKSLDGTK
ncbi:hypothetical protein CANINC_000040 [Pichia inconspicua]|uniref:Uncharacterized protein n=1 Tax=Pichia inconspicua TaxID=52247 RepID=A0A4T0X7A4_9ASCO|nr:hypothetical protein CANINC_000040 [[Candida] inconspicua]